MATVFRWLLRLCMAAVVLAVLAVVGVYYLASRSLPEYTKTLVVGGLSAPVEIVRDHANVPHILGKRDEDVFFAMGYAHAQDRLWQMVMARRKVQGRMSELLGRAHLESDALMRRLDLYGLSVGSAKVQDSATQRILSAYAQGVNARVAEVNRDALGRGAPEMFLFKSPVAPWQPADSIALLKLMAFEMSGHLRNEVLRARSSLVLDDPARIRDLMPDIPGNGTATGALSPLLREEYLLARKVAGLASVGPVPGAPGASNVWAAAPRRSAAGGSLLANDPHMAFSAPARWYLARLDLESGPVIGGTVPGIPVVFSGRSERFGWGITASYLDDQDIFLEQLNPDNSEEYRTPSGYQAFLSRKSIVPVREGEPLTLTLRWSENGPILPASYAGVGTITPKDHVAALSWTGLSPADTTMSAALAIMKAQTTGEALSAAEGFIAPSLNLTVIDTQNIALKSIGAMPRRSARHQTLGRLPSFGYEAVNRWQGRLPYSANPGFVAPPGGLVGNTNNKIVERPFPMHVSYHWGDSQRVKRWRKLMKDRKVHTRESFIEAQLDTVSPTARTLLPLVGADLWFTGDPAPEGTPERRRQKALEMLGEWNGEMNEHLPEPLIYAAWMRALQERLIRDELGIVADDYTHVEPLFIERVFRNTDGAAAWCDVVQSAPEESCTEIARQALDDALIWLGETYGTEPEALRWGDAHQAVHPHPQLDRFTLVRPFVTLRQSTSGGDNTLMRGLTKGGGGAEAFVNVHGAGYRGVYDLADPDSSVFIIPTGQSGHFLSRHYDDLGALWRRGEYIPMSLDTGLARAASVGITTLEPSR